MNIRFIQIFLAFSLLITTFQAEGQSKRVPAGLAKYKNFQIPGRVKVDNGDPMGTVVNLINLDSKQTEKSITVPSSGKFDFELNYFKEYKITVSKDGYYDKELRISTVIPRNVWEKDSVFPPFSIIVSLYKKIDDYNKKLSFEGKIIGKIYYSPNGRLDNFDSDVFVDEQTIQDELNNALKSIIDKRFNQKIAEALEYEKKRDLPNAYRVYTEALKIKPGDKFVIEKLKELASDMKDLENEAKMKAEFDRLIALGDANILIIKYMEAVQNFKDALKVIPNNPVALSKLAGAEKLLAQAIEKAKQDAEFNRLIAEGDANVKQTKYPEAITNFKGALGIRPNNPVALAKLAEAEKLLAQAIEKAKQDAEFNRLIAEGDANVKKVKYPEAITNFKGALGIRPNDPVALAKLAEAEKLLAQAIEKAKQDAEFNRLIAEGDANVKKVKYPEAITNFKGALGIRPNDPVALAKLAEAEKLLAQAIEKAKQDAEFNRLIAEGDANVKKVKYPEAITNFKGALGIRPNDPVALAKLAEAEKLLAQETEFNRLIAEGDGYVKETKYAEAINSFKGALKIKPNNPVAVAKLAEAEKLLAQETEFNRLIAEGDGYVKETKYAEAINSFKGALKIKPNNPVAVAKLAEAEKLLAQETEFNRLIAEGDGYVKETKYAEAINSFKGALKIKPNNPVAVAKLAEAEKLLAQETEFNRLIAEGDGYVKETKYAEAINSFKGALKIKPNNPVAVAKLAEAEKLLAQETEFNRLIAEGDGYVKETKYAEAINSFKGALKIKPNNPVAVAKLAEAEKLLAQETEFNRLIAEGDGYVKETKYAEAINSFKGALKIKPNNPVAVAKLAEAEKLLAQETEFNRLIAEGDGYVKETKYAEAINSFKGALKIKPNNPVAVAKLAEAEKLLAQETEFNRLIAEGDGYVKETKYAEAINSFKGALKIKPNNPVAVAKLAEAEKLLAQETEFNRLIAEGDGYVKETKYAEAINSFKGALKIKPNNPVAVAKLAEAEKLLAQETEFNRLIAEGDGYVKETKYAEAINSFKGALKIKPNNPVAVAKLAEAEKLLAQETEFNRLIAEGDGYVKETKYAEAINSFKGALKIKPNNPVAVAKLAEAEKLLAQETEFNRLIAEGDGYVKETKYAEAINSFKGALKIKPNNPVAVAKLAEAEKLLAQETEFNRLIAEGDGYVKETKYAEAINSFKGALKIKPNNPVAVAKLAEAEKLLAQETEFNRLIAEGDGYVKETKYAEAINSFKGALKIKPNNPVAVAKLAEAEKLLAQETEFNRLIAEGDGYVKETKYAEAINSFKGALKIKPNNPVAVAKLAEAEKLLAQETEFNRLIAEGDGYVKETKYAEAINSFKGALKIKPNNPVAVAKLAEAEKLLAQETEFNRLIAEGDGYVKETKYAEAINSFKGALKIKPNNPVAVAKLAEAEKLLAQETEFNRLIAEGDGYVKETKYAEAINSFKGALKIKPNNPVAVAKLAEAEKLLAQETEFNRLIAEGDGYVKETKYAEAINSFKGALKIKPNNPVAVAKLAEAEKLLAQETEFNRLIAEGDGYVKETKYAEAINSFKGALKIKPNNPVAVAKLAEAEKLLAQETEFNRLIAEGDGYVKETKYAEAINSFKGALKIKPNNPVAVAKLAEAEKLLAQETEFNRLIAEGDGYVKETKYAEAINSFKGALKIKPNNPVAVAKLAEAEKLLAQETEFNRLIAEGDGYVKETKYAEAINSFKGALKIKPNNPVAVAKLAEAEKLLAQSLDKAKQDAEFNRLMAEGDANVKQTKYQEAITNFKGALGIRPNDPVALAKLAEAEKLLAQSLDKAKQDAEFNRLMAEGDANVKQTKYQEAITNFKGALGIRPNDPVALAKLAEAEKLLAQSLDKAKQDAEFNRLMAEGDANVKQTKYQEAITNFKGASGIRPNDPVALAKLAEAEKLLAQSLDKAKQDAEFNRLMAEGDANVKQTKYQEAITNFKGALGIRPNDPVALAKLAEAEKLLAQSLDKAKQDAEFNRLMAEGDANVKQTKYQEAITNFKEALGIRPNDPVALAKLAEAEKLLAQSLDKAKQDAEFNRLMAEGDANVKQTKYQEAITNFKGALGIRPNDPVALAKLAEAEKLLAQSLDKAKQDAEFNRLMAEGDANVKQTKYQEAITNFKGALGIRPNDPVALAKLAEAEKLLAQSLDKAKQDAEFNRLMAEGDANVKQTKYQEAITNFKGALGIRPNDPVALAKLAEAEKLLAQSLDKAKQDAEFNRLMAEGDANVKQTKYQEAITNFKGALGIRPNDPVALAKLAEAEKLLAQSLDKAKQDAEFNRLMAEGDANVKQTKYQEAITNFKGALGIRPNDPVALAKLAEAEKLLAQSLDKAKQDAEFNRLMAEGDANVKQTKYQEAITNFKGALGIRPNDPVALAKLAEAEKLLAQSLDKAKQDAEFNRLMAEGDANVKQTKYQEAITNFKGALGIRPNDPVALAKLAEAEKLLAQSLDKAKQDAEFNRLMAEGDANVKQTKYQEAITNFKGALGIRPNDPVALAKLAEAEKLLAQSLDKAKQDAEFNRLMAEGDANVKQTKYQEAITNFKGALGIRPNDPVALAKLAEAEKLLAQSLDKAKQDAEFNRLMAEGDANVKQTKYQEAITNFKGALGIRPNDPVALAKLAEAEKLLAQSLDKAKQDAEFNRLMAEGDANVKQTKYQEAITNFKGALGIRPNDPVALAKLAEAEKLLAQSLDKAKQDAEFNRLMAEGDANVKQTKYQEAITNFKGALGIRPNDPVALAKLAEAEKLLAQSLDKAKQDAEFNRLMAEGDANVKQTKYQEAITNFKGALGIRPNDPVALAKLAEAEKLLAQSLDKAKQDAEFNRLMAEGDANVKQTKYQEAITNFKGALGIRPNDPVALAKLAEAEKLLAQSLDKAKQDAEFNRLMAEGDANVKQTKYQEAITNFKGALGIRPNDPVALAKLAEAEKLLAQSLDKAKQDAEFNRLMAEGDANVKQTKYQEAITNFKGALGIRPNDPVALAKLAEAEKLLAQSLDKAKQDAEFNRLMAEGDANVKQTKYQEAITNFKGALGIRPNDPVALAKLAEAEKLLAQSLDKAKQDAEFNRLMAEGDANVKQTKYQEAITNFKGALGIRPNDPVALAKLAEAEKLLAQSLDKAKQDAEFNRLMAEGDANVKQTKYQEAITNFKGALGIRPNDPVALAKLAEAEKLLAQARELAITKLYNEAIMRGASYFADKQYSNAILAYREAQKLKPNEILPPERIREIQAIIDALARRVLTVNRSSDDDKLSPIDKLYFEKIRLGDENFKKAQWSIARFYYMEGLKIKQNDKYSLDRIEACDQRIESEITAEKMQEYNNKVANADTEMKSKNYSSARFYYHSALTIMNWESYPQQKLKEIDRIFTEQLSTSDQKVFKESLNKADNAYDHREYPEARFYYNKALEISTTDHIVSRLKEIESIVNGFVSNKEKVAYDDYIKKGDEALKQKNRGTARFYFQKASSLKPDENYPKDKIKKIDSESSP